MARTCGFDNINVDLISAIPKQTLQSWEETLSKVIAVNPEHISAYSLIVEEGTLFYKLYGDGGAKENDLPDEDTEREIYKKTEVILNQAGYHRYEISNYAKEGKECKHNLGYWERKNYLGFGLGAASLMENVRYKNTDNLEFYMGHAKCPKIIQEDIQQLTEQEQIEEFMFLGLRKTEGISKTEFFKTFGTPLETYYETQINRFLGEKLLQTEGDRLYLTKRGIDISNYVLSEFIK